VVDSGLASGALSFFVPPPPALIRLTSPAAYAQDGGVSRRGARGVAILGLLYLQIRNKQEIAWGQPLMQTPRRKRSPQIDVILGIVDVTKLL
jgi:hypothetical protein